MTEQRPTSNTPPDPFTVADPMPGGPFSHGSTAPTARSVAAASFTGRTPRKTAAIRAGIIIGTGLLVVIGAAVAMGASPTPAPSAGGQPQTQPERGNGNGNGFFGPFGKLGPAGPGPDGNAFGRGKNDLRGFGQVSVTAISGSSVSLATADGWTRTITVTSTTTITKGGAAAKLADLAVGDSIHFRQTRTSDNTWTITAIDIIQPRIAGKVTAVGSDTVTITLKDGTSQTIKTTGSTTYHLEKADGTRADVSVGATILATGDKAADGNLTAESIWISLPRVAGTVTGTTGSTITISRRDGTTLTIHVGSGTTIRVAGIDAAKLSDVESGMVIVVEGTERADGSIDARAIGAGKTGLGRGQDKKLDHGPKASGAPDASGGTTG